mgnify:CR=1 FL=1
MLTDVQIAQSAEMLPIKEVAAKLGLSEDDLELYGKYKAKISNNVYEKLKDKKDGKLILVTAINPTSAGEGKTTTSVGLADSLNYLDNLRNNFNYNIDILMERVSEEAIYNHIYTPVNVIGFISSFIGISELPIFTVAATR